MEFSQHIVFAVPATTNDCRKSPRPAALSSLSRFTAKSFPAAYVIGRAAKDHDHIVTKRRRLPEENLPQIYLAAPFAICG